MELSWNQHLEELASATTTYTTILQRRSAAFEKSLDHIAERRRADTVDDEFEEEVKKIVEKDPVRIPIVAKPPTPPPPSHETSRKQSILSLQRPAGVADQQASERALALQRQHAQLADRLAQLRAQQAELIEEEESALRRASEVRHGKARAGGMDDGERDDEDHQDCRIGSPSADGDSENDPSARSDQAQGVDDSQNPLGNVVSSTEAEGSKAPPSIPSAVKRPLRIKIAATSRIAAAIGKVRELNASTAPQYFDLGLRDHAAESLTMGIAAAYAKIVREQELARTESDTPQDEEPSPEDMAQIYASKKLLTEVQDEKMLLGELCESMVDTCQQDLQNLEAAVAYQKNRQRVLEATLSNLISLYTARDSKENLLNPPAETPPPKAPGDRKKNLLADDDGAGSAESDEEKSDEETSSDESDDLSTGDKQMIIGPNGQVRMCVPIQTNQTLSPNVRGNDDHRFEKVAQHERALRKAIGQLQALLDQLISCNETFEGELCCPLCHQSQVELLVMWPCGHQFCFDCIFSYVDEETRDYICPDCNNRSSEMPIVNIAVNSISGRIAFKRSGFGDLQRAFAAFRKNVFEVEMNFVAQVSSHYRILSDGVEFASYENVVTRNDSIC